MTSKSPFRLRDDERPENYIQEVTVATGIVIVKQYEKMVVLRLGQYTGSLKSAGFHFLVPFFYTGKIVDTRGSTGAGSNPAIHHEG